MSTDSSNIHFEGNGPSKIDVKCEIICRSQDIILKRATLTPIYLAINNI
jgi:hypothetical protein